MGKNLKTSLLKEKKSSVYKKNGGKHVTLTIYDTLYNLEIVSINHIREGVSVERYMPELKCGFVRDKGKSILTFDLRNNGHKPVDKEATVLMVTAKRNNISMPIGFVIENIEDFTRELY